MTEVTVTDYETTEVQKTKYQCDHCGVHCDECEANSVAISEGVAEFDSMEWVNCEEVRHLCEDCLNVREALQIREKRTTIQDRWQSFAEALNPLTNVLWVSGAFLCGVGTIWIVGGATVEGAAGIVVGEVVVSSLMAVFFVMGYTLLCGAVFGDITE